MRIDVTITSETAAAMNSGVLTAVVMAVSAAAVAAITGWYSYRAARRNSEATRQVERDKLSTDSWERQVKAWREDVVALRQQRAEDSKIHEEHRKECSRQIGELTTEVRHLQRQRDSDEERHQTERQTVAAQLAVLVTWAKNVVVLLNSAGIAFPPPPPGIQDTDPRIPRVT